MVEVLKSALQMAQQGKIVNCAVVLVSEDAVMENYANELLPFMLLGAIEIMKQDFTRQYIDGLE